eukprot:1196056-Prorocentrum_minimum.AAC.4
MFTVAWCLPQRNDTFRTHPFPRSAARAPVKIVAWCCSMAFVHGGDTLLKGGLATTFMVLFFPCVLVLLLAGQG